MSSVKHTAPRPAPRCQRYSRALLWCCITAIFPVSAQQPAVPDAGEAPMAAADEAPTPPAATEAVKTEPTQPVAERLAEQQRQLLYDLKGPPTSLWLPVGDKQVLAFWQPDRSGKPVGAVLMLHDAGESPRRAATLRRLHEYLPIHGWATFSVELPDLPPMGIPARPTPPPVAEPKTPPSPTEPSADKAEPSADKAEPPAEEKAVDETQVVHQETDEAAPAESVEAPPPSEPVPAASREEVIANIHQRIEAATAYLHQQGQYNLVLLGEGSSAHWVLQHLGKAAPPPPVESADKKSKGIIDRAFRAVILVNAQTPAGAELEPLAEALRHPEIPTFDVFTDLYLDTLAEAKNRRQVAKQQGYESYIVRRLPPPKGADPENIETLLTKAIRGFLHKYAQGVELK